MFERIDTQYIIYDELIKKYGANGKYFDKATTGQIYLLKHR